MAVEKYGNMDDAIALGVIPALNGFEDDFDVEEIASEYFTWNGRAFVPAWTIEHPDWEEEEGFELFWQIVRSNEGAGE